MAEFTPAIAAEIVAACQAGAAEAASAFSRALDATLQLEIQAAATWAAASAPAELSGPGLVVLLKTESAAAVLLIPQSTGLLPAWVQQPDPTGVSKLATLAQELGMLLLPEQFMPSDFQAAYQVNLLESLTRGGIEEGAGLLPVTLTVSGGAPGQALLIWPLPAADKIIAAAQAAAETIAAEQSIATEEAEVKGPARGAAPRVTDPAFETLPPYTRSLLRVKVAVAVTLATKKQPVQGVIELVPGAIIQFSKPCDEMLEFEANGHRIAQGECVKVGDKFGIRLTSMILPDERFARVG